MHLVFLKCLSDVFDDEVNRLTEDYGDKTTALEIAEADHSLLRFYLQPEARWAVISGSQNTEEAYAWPLDDKGRSTAPKDAGEHLTRALRGVVKPLESLRGVGGSDEGKVFNLVRGLQCTSCFTCECPTTGGCSKHF